MTIDDEALEKAFLAEPKNGEDWFDTVAGATGLTDEENRILLRAAITAYLTTIEAKGLVIVPVEPTDELLMSMAVRYDHGLGMPGYYDQPIFKQLEGKNHIPHSRRVETALSQMRQIHEEVVGMGFYSPENADRDRTMLSTQGGE